MMNNFFVGSDGTTLPLTRIALCLDCERCFALGRGGCPACGSETWVPVARFFANAPRDPEVFGLRAQLVA
jgi:hypothetical protein